MTWCKGVIDVLFVCVWICSFLLYETRSNIHNNHIHPASRSRKALAVEMLRIIEEFCHRIILEIIPGD